MWVILITISKIFHLIVKHLNLGTGNTWPGHLILKIYPSIFRIKNIYPKKGLIFISATNGKTTTSKIVTHVLANNGFKVLSNTSGANLLNGVLSSLLLDTTLTGNARADYGVFEVDEFALPLLLSKITPDILMLLNLSRDQLDRYGEVDVILDRWHQALTKLPSSTTVVMPSNYPTFDTLIPNISCRVDYFEDTSIENTPTNLKSLFNRKNLGASLTALKVLGVSDEQSLRYLTNFELAWGRGETLNYQNCLWQLYLAKNPMSFNLNLQHMLENTSEFSTLPVLIIFNDNIPDGRDVSWIYDIEPNLLYAALATNKLYLAGKRVYDMAVRLKYAGLNVLPENIFSNISTAVINIVSQNNGKKIIVLPNYSAMLEVRKVLTGRRIL